MTGQGVLWGRGAVVVGGSSGIGFAVAAALAKQGAGVVVNGRNEAAVERAANAIRMSGNRVVGVAGSAADEIVADKLVSTCAATFGAVDILVNCAGAAEPPASSILTVKPWEWRALLDSHLTTVFNTCRAVAPRMVEQGRGSIINTSSFAYLGDYGGTGYAAGKGAVTSLTLAMAAELREYGIRANIVCPGAKTRLSSGLAYEARILDLYRRGILDEVAMGGALDAPPAEHVAQLYLYLASQKAADVTGRIFIGAGGFIGRFKRPETAVLGYRDHAESPPWSLAELHDLIDENAANKAG
ncbi:MULTISPECIES: SDR family NAD(P)-dependent oxidoreductase [Nocardia]|uniref:SDR family NAD(P)-dependent oxidoreductase n=1 Tax=Nocardia TaxID=1817 RepID=UPI000D696841|nr:MULTISPECIES: SDR family oxidoreductase [Nocardia]